MFPPGGHELDRRIVPPCLQPRRLWGKPRGATLPPSGKRLLLPSREYRANEEICGECARVTRRQATRLCDAACFFFFVVLYYFILYLKHARCPVGQDIAGPVDPPHLVSVGLQLRASPQVTHSPPALFDDVCTYVRSRRACAWSAYRCAVFIRYLRLPEKRPEYRSDRSHADFLCTLASVEVVIGFLIAPCRCFCLWSSLTRSMFSPAAPDRRPLTSRFL